MDNDAKPITKFTSFYEVIDSAKTIDIDNTSEVARFVWRLYNNPNLAKFHISKDEEISVVQLEVVTKDDYYIHYGSGRHGIVITISCVDFHLRYEEVDDEYDRYQSLKLYNHYFKSLFDTSDDLIMPDDVTIKPCNELLRDL